MGRIKDELEAFIREYRDRGLSKRKRNLDLLTPEEREMVKDMNWLMGEGRASIVEGTTTHPWTHQQDISLIQTGGITCPLGHGVEWIHAYSPAWRNYDLKNTNHGTVILTDVHDEVENYEAFVCKNEEHKHHPQGPDTRQFNVPKNKVPREYVP